MKISLFVTFILLQFSLNAQIFFQNLRSSIKNDETKMSFCIENNPENLKFLHENNITIKNLNDQWIYFSANKQEFSVLEANPKLNISINFSKPFALADSAVVRHKINLVHDGVSLDTNYTGKGVILGIVDQGLDYNHPDFKNPDGSTRVLRYWDHTISAPTIYDYYGYGVLWDSSAINNETCTSNEIGTAHGTTVTGLATGNGSANGKNKGVAPESDIVIVETDFNLPNWTLTIADACDYIFKVADSLNKPAVINLSLGGYLGSHDAKDAAALLIDDLLDEHSGRIIVCAAGNSGDEIPYHVHNDVDTDTSFFWNLNNPGNTYVGNNKILIDFWTDTINANYEFSYAADRPSPNYGFVGRTSSRNAMDNSNNEVVNDTLYNTNGDRIATIQTWRNIEGDRLHMQTIFWTIDSLDYLFRFESYGSGSFDAWGGAWQLLSDFETNVPDVSVMPNIIHYRMPDTLQSIVTSWACSEKVITVGNTLNRDSYTDNNGNIQTNPSNTNVGEITNNSSKGPARTGVQKPDVSASGDWSFGSGPFWLLDDPSNNSIIEDGGFHVRNGGTSMSSPVVAGTAALFLQKCKNASYSDFKSAIQNTSTTDQYTGLTPNYAYGYGKLDAHEVLLQNHQPVTIEGPDGICVGDLITLSYNTAMNPTNINWNNGSSNASITTSQPGIYSVTLTDDLGCISRSNQKIVSSYSLPIVDAGPNRIECPNEEIVLNATGTATTYIWNGNIQNNEPFVPEDIGYYHVTGTNENGCSDIDSCFIDFYNVMDVTYIENNTLVGLNSLEFNLTEGIPAGGVYSGSGVIGTSFHPGLAGTGIHPIIYAVENTNGCLSRDTSFIEVYEDADLLEQNSLDLIIKPNPNNGQFDIISNQNGFVEIYDLNGKLILKQNLRKDKTTYFDLNSAGIYHLLFVGDKHTEHSKIIVSY